ADKRAERLKKLAALNPDAPEAALLKARAAMLTEDWSGAVEILEKAIEAAPSAAAYALMAQAAAGLKGADAARVWLEYAASAPRDPRPGADGEFHLTRDGWARLIREYMEFGRLTPPPVEEALSAPIAEEVRYLLAPPEPKPAPETPVLHDVEDAQGVIARPEYTGDHEQIHDDEEAERAAAAARNVS
ncbi:MAG: tetratricopeptide repeat protein, partial [Parvularculaceae bacterium]